MRYSEQQIAIIEHPLNKHAKVIAVAGSGKSATVVGRIEYLINNGVSPAQILAVMFNRDAANEMSERLLSRLGKHRAPQSITFHRLGTLTLSWLTRERFVEPYEFVADTFANVRFVLDHMINLFNQQGCKYPRLIAETFLGFVDRVKSDLQSPERVFSNGSWPDTQAWFIQAYSIYEKHRHAAKKRFFSDLIYDPVMLMAENHKAARYVANRFAHIIVDEYQDICESQQRLVSFVAGSKARLMVVGDDDQTIYTWRGAKPEYILSEFENEFKGASTYELTRTWRYGHAVSCAANYVIGHNINRAGKLCISGATAPNTNIRLHLDEKVNASVIPTIKQWMSHGRKLDDATILVRAFSHSGMTQLQLLENAIPFRLIGNEDASILSNDWVASLISWLRLANGEFGQHECTAEDELQRTVYRVKKLLPRVLTRFNSYSFENQLCRSVAANPLGTVGFENFIFKSLKRSDESSLEENLKCLAEMWVKYKRVVAHRECILVTTVFDELLNDLDIEARISASCKTAEQAEDTLEMVLSFYSYVQSHESMTLKAFLKHLDNLEKNSEAARKIDDAVSITSIHRSKGLEFPLVLMISLTNKRFPIDYKGKAGCAERMEQHLEDERRLFYVAMTRAIEHLHLFAPADSNLDLWLKAGNSGSPANLERTDTVGSMFLYESNLYLSRDMPRFLSLPATRQGRFATTPNRFNDYLAELGLTTYISRIKHSG